MTTTAKIRENVLKLWNAWEIQMMLLVSFLLQLILIVCGSRRKYIPKFYIRLIVWTAYLLADVMAIAALGNLSQTLGDAGFCSTKPNHELRIIWAPFLLLHLGGPDTITAYAVQDNDLWLRHLFSLVIQVGGAFYIFFKSWNITILTFIAIPVFVSGLIKYGERTWVLRSSSTNNMKDSLLAAPPRLRLDTKEIMVVPRPHYVPETNYLHQAYYLFKISEYLFQGFILSFTELKDSQSIISRQSSSDAFKLVEVELGFMYDLLYTKASTSHTPLGIFLRSISFSTLISAFVVFLILVDKHTYSVVDLDITYLLLVGAFVLELYAFFHLIVSDRTMIWLTKFQSPPANPIAGAIFSLHTKWNRKRWSESIAQYNLISSGLIEMRREKFWKRFGVAEMKKHVYIKFQHINDDLKDLIFMQLLEKANVIVEHLHDTNWRNKLIAQRGDGVLEKMEQLDKFQWSTIAIDFHQSLLIWHIATDLCYYSRSSDDDTLSLKRKSISKSLSDYMFYLLVIRPHTLPKGIGDSGSRYRDAYEEVNRFSKSQKIESSITSGIEEQTCINLLGMEYADLEDIIAGPIDTTTTIPGAYGRSKYMLVHGSMLAKQLQLLNLEEKWKMISEVWIEMLAYAASQCEWKEHAEQLRRGGELLTHVCLLMAHLGLSQQYQEILGNS